MPAKKTRKPKYTAGVLARDWDEEALVVFYPSLTAEQMRRGLGGLWLCVEEIEERNNYTEWSHKDWKATYDLTDENGKPCAPPRKGQAFPCDVEL